jgi:hypothetical protein
MPSLIDYKGLSVLDSATGDGGAAINDDLMEVLRWRELKVTRAFTRLEHGDTLL